MSLVDITREAEIEERVRSLPSRTEMLYTKLGETIDEIHALGRRMAKEFERLGDCQMELESKGVKVEPEFPAFVLTALSVYRNEQQRQAAESERAR